MAPLESPRPRSTRWQVAMAHGHYVPPDEWSEQSHRAWLISDADLRATGADYVALGHWDRAAEVGDGGVPACYSGSPDLAGTANVIRFGAHGVTVRRAPLQWT
jgi:DNA repair exonuclease SbcCD nuclease subunit